MSDIVKGTAIKGMSRPSRRYGRDRVCAQADCDTKLSQYNKREYCFSHAPVRFPRVRGRVATGT
ncbi:MAG: hypothetical protein GEU79_12940 [Acidimicrobiia bacterium]|nr:hypothetical protein [Acidimicrobiia bacterium]